MTEPNNGRGALAAGGLAAILFELVTPEVLSTTRSASYLLFVFLGGATVFGGPILGAVLMVLSLVLLSEWTQAWLLYLGLAFVLMVILAPAGLAGLLRDLASRLPALMQRGRAAWWWALLQLGLPVLLAGAGLVGLVEMLYHRQLSLAMGPQLKLLGMHWDVDAPVSWLVALACLIPGAAWARWAWRRHAATLCPADQPPGA